MSKSAPHAGDERRTSTERVNAVNVALMLASAGVAWVVPFEMFLLSYAVLGPLHYLTEISWLHDRSYFLAARFDAGVLIALGVLDFVAHYTRLVSWNGFVALAFALAAVFVLTEGVRGRVALGAAAVVATLGLERWGGGWLFLVVLLPTIIHVFCFTGLFILHGSVRGRSPWGWASLVVFVACGVGLLLAHPPAGHYAVGPRTAALAEQFGPVIDQLLAISRAPQGWDGLVAVGRFLAFAYTYHYLNWFSKTRIIGWHATTTRRMVLIVAVYAASLVLYGYDYRVGLAALFLLSVVHVLLEFPLDVRTFVALVGQGGTRMRSRGASPAGPSLAALRSAP